MKIRMKMRKIKRRKKTSKSINFSNFKTIDLKFIKQGRMFCLFSKYNVLFRVGDSGGGLRKCQQQWISSLSGERGDNSGSAIELSSRAEGSWPLQ